MADILKLEIFYALNVNREEMSADLLWDLYEGTTVYTNNGEEDVEAALRFQNNKKHKNRKKDWRRKRSKKANTEKLYCELLDMFLQTGHKHYQKAAAKLEQHVDQKIIDQYRNCSVVSRRGKHSGNRKSNTTNGSKSEIYFV